MDDHNNTERAGLGILGGGQLARMLLQAATSFGLDVAVMEGAPDSPAGRLARHEIVGGWGDEAALRRLAAVAPVVTLENEFVPARSLYLLEELGVVVVPGSAALAAAQDKLHQKARLDGAGLPVPPFTPVEDAADVLRAARELGWPLLLKRRRNGYDGYGNRVLRGPDDIAPAIIALRGTPDPARPEAERALMVEGYVRFTRELAVMVVRGRQASGVRRQASGGTPAGGNETGTHAVAPELSLASRLSPLAYPVVETVQRDGVCHYVYAPADVAAEVAARATEIARAAVAALDLEGVCGVELFLAEDGALTVNELAPRVHNSGHYTIEACVTSQFENAVRAALGLPLGATALLAPAATMVNLLGAPDSPAEPRGLTEALAVSGAHIHLYGKRGSRPGRKMGHVTALGTTRAEATAIATRAAQCIRV